jgi:uncharacterized protein DUF5681
VNSNQESTGPETQGPSSEPYRVGPGRPPREYQFKPGQSGNPGGRRKTESLTAIMRRVLEREHQGRPIAELLVERLIKETLSGKLPHMKEILDRVEGKVAEKMKVEATGPVCVVMNIPAPRLIGEPEADALAQAVHEQKVREFHQSVPPSTLVVQGECWDQL